MKNTKRTQSGRSMIEMVGVLAVTGLLTAGAFVLIQSGMASQKRSRAADEINALVSNIRGLAAESDSFDKLAGTNPTATQMGASGTLPTAPTSSSSQATNAKSLLKLSSNTTPLGGYYAVTGDASSFAVWLVGIDSSECQTMQLRSYTGSPTVKCSSTTLVLRYTK